MELIAKICTAIVSKQLTDELKAWTPKLIEWLIDRAVQRLPEHERDRYFEEWHSHIDELPGEIAKIAIAIQLLYAARRMSSLLTQKTKETDASELAAGIFAFSVATLSVIFFAPVLLIIGLIIKLQSPEPCFYQLARVGRNGRKFGVYFFQTPKERRFESNNKDDQGYYRLQLTKFGDLLKRSSLDHLPNFFSIIRGDMALVGPRPLRTEEAAILFDLFPNYKEILKVKPGMTGLAQVSGSTTLKEWIDLDLYYVENRSLNLDLQILMKTVVAVLTNGPCIAMKKATT